MSALSGNEIAAKLDEARALIEKGWTRGEYRRGRCYCTIGAIAQASAGAPDADMFLVFHSPAFRVVRGVFAQANDIPIYDIAIWNDGQKSKKPVIEAFRKAAELARAGGVQ